MLLALLPSPPSRLVGFSAAISKELCLNKDMKIEQQMKEKYDHMFKLAQEGLISQQEWFEFTHDLLSKIMDENKDVFVRLKNR